VGVKITIMTMRDYAEALVLWESAEGVRLSKDDSRPNIAKYLRRNPGMSFVARDGKQLVGAVLCGHDGRRGCLYHLAVAPSRRRRGIGAALVERCLAKLRTEGIRRCRVFIVSGNRGGRAFWRALGWTSHPGATDMVKDLDSPG
jgi:ribosomal protein S18 acetylase RimI-like enzyme